MGLTKEYLESQIFIEKQQLKFLDKISSFKMSISSETIRINERISIAAREMLQTSIYPSAQNTK